MKKKQIQIEYMNISELHPYENNPRKNADAVDAVAKSIKQFGFKSPIIIDANNEIICGHTRYLASKKLRIKSVPVVRADDLSEEEIRAYRLADNKVAELAGWDKELLDLELGEIETIDMADFGFDLSFDWETEHQENQEATQEKVEGILNTGKGVFVGEGKYDMPKMNPVYDMPDVKEWISFNYVLSDTKPEGKGVHFFIDDYQFERCWRNPDAYIDKLSQYECVLSPDFSPYSDMPMRTQIFNHYRKQWLACYWQYHGITVIPTIRASRDERSLEWYLDGMPHDGIVAISAMWTSNNDDAKQYFIEKEYEQMFNTLNPKKVLVYGGKEEILKELKGETERIKSFAETRYKEDN